MPNKEDGDEVQEFVSELLFKQTLKKMFSEEHAFLRSLEDIMTRCTTNEALSDSMKQMFSTTSPFEKG